MFLERTSFNMESVCWDISHFEKYFTHTTVCQLDEEGNISDKTKFHYNPK